VIEAEYQIASRNLADAGRLPPFNTRMARKTRSTPVKVRGHWNDCTAADSVSGNSPEKVGVNS
jgi:hypothetical protein